MTDAGTGMPGPQLCAVCHDTQDVELPPEDRIAALFDDAGRYQREQLVSLSREVIYSHRTHVGTYQLDCADCHGDMAETAGWSLPIGKKECMECHSEAGRPNDCATCHREITMNWAPPNHERAWRIVHGDVVHSGDPSSVNRCAMCHDQESSCQACHLVEQPRDHTNFWRRRGHGIMTSLDRSSCATCHRSDFCQRCHESTRPVSHRGGWGSPLNRHCTQCHFPLQSTSCFTCHKSDPSHNQATPLPPDHNPAMNCRSCHGNGAPLPHHDPGALCTQCHR
jgi:hypothetical protein